jgi:hypothetical protein
VHWLHQLGPELVVLTLLGIIVPVCSHFGPRGDSLPSVEDPKDPVHFAVPARSLSSFFQPGVNGPPLFSSVYIYIYIYI